MTKQRIKRPRPIGIYDESTDTAIVVRRKKYLDVDYKAELAFYKLQNGKLVKWFDINEAPF